MKRVDWTVRLAATLEAHRHLPFRWGARSDAHDCCTFVAACIDAMAGTRRVDELLTNYHDEATARAYIAISSGMGAAVATYLGTPKPVSRLRTGDVTLAAKKGIEFVGIVVDKKIYSAGARGLVSHRLACAILAWSV